METPSRAHPASDMHSGPESSAPQKGSQNGPDLDSFVAVLDFLDSLGLFHSDYALDRMEQALAVLGFNAALPFAVVQIVGTNGKGSTATFLASLAQAHGIRTGLYTSPHFVTPRERIRINGTMIAPEAWPALARKVHAAAPALTYFEFLTVLALLAFVEARVDLVVLEAGLGGRYDATTAVPAEMVCFTPIGLDHEKVLGHTVAAIATDKAQAARPGCRICTGPQVPEAMDVLTRRARDLAQPLLRAGPLPPEAILGLEGPHQQDNARLALTAWRLLAAQHQWPVTEAQIRTGLAQARIAGRLQRAPLTPGFKKDEAALPLVLDGGHNAHGLRALAAALVEARLRPRAVIFSCLADKNLTDMLPLVLDMAGKAPIFTPTIQDNERAMDGAALAAALGPSARPMPRLHAALAAARVLPPSSDLAPEAQPVVICGSLYLLGEFFTLCPHWLE